MAKNCVQCGMKLSFRNEFQHEDKPICRDCLDALSPAKNAPLAARADKPTPKRDFGTLVVVGSIMSFLGWVVAVLGPIGALVSFDFNNDVIFGVISDAIMAVVVGVSLVAFGQLLACLVSIERNTHATLMAAQKTARE